MKTCSNKECGAELPLSEFHRTTRTYETTAGLVQKYIYHHSQCKTCRNRVAAAYRKEYYQRIKRAKMERFKND